MLVGVGDALEEFFLEFVLFCIWIGIAAMPEVLDKFFPLLVRCEFFPGVAFGLSEKRIDVSDPIDIRLLDLALYFAWLFFGIAFGLLSRSGKG